MRNRHIIKESERVELKRSLSEHKEILETISAFSNASGGTIYVGIDPSGHTVGVVIGARTMEHLANEIKQNTDPKVFPSIESQSIDGKQIVRIAVQEFPMKPVWAFDKVFIRVGRSNQRASAEKIREFLRESLPFRWDHQIPPKASLSEIDVRQVQSFLRRAKEERNAFFEGSKQVSTVLSRLRLQKNGKPTLAAILLFGKDPQSRAIQAQVRCGRFIGTEPVDFADMKVFQGTIIDQVREALDFIQRHINVGARITGKPEREDVWEYPKEALREAIVNAVCHRDYEDPGNVQVRIFDDRLEVWSPGVLPPGVTVESLQQEHGSKPRNGLIADCFYLIKYIEQWGTGTNRIISLCKEAGLKAPEFSQRAGSFVITFWRTKSRGKTVKPVITLGQTQESILRYIKEHGAASTAELENHLEISARAVRKNLAGMRHLLRWTGKSANDPTGRYVLLEGSE